MSVVILFNQKKSEDWLQKLKELLPTKNIEVYPHVEDSSKVEFLITWKPHEGYVHEFPNLKVVQSVGAGIDHLLHTPIGENIQISRIVDPALKQDMFEFILSNILASMKNLHFYAREQNENRWSPIEYKSIQNTSVTILGLGEIGKLVAEKLSFLGFEVRGWSNSEKSIEGVQSYYGREGLDQAIAATDFVVNILPLTNETEGILNQNFFRKLSSSTVLINVARGGHLMEEDLIEAINLGIIKEAFIDVFHLEPLTYSHPFWQHPKIHITPHIASITNPDTAIQQVVENIFRLENGQTLMNLVDLKRGY